MAQRYLGALAWVSMHFCSCSVSTKRWLGTQVDAGQTAPGQIFHDWNLHHYLILFPHSAGRISRYSRMFHPQVFMLYLSSVESSFARSCSFSNAVISSALQSLW
jgi:hypothetical protein